MKENEKNVSNETIDEEFPWSSTKPVPALDHKVFDAENGVGDYKTVDGETKYAYGNSLMCPGETIPFNKMLKLIDRGTGNGSTVVSETKSAPGYHKSETTEYSKLKITGNPLY